MKKLINLEELLKFCEQFAPANSKIITGNVDNEYGSITVKIGYWSVIITTDSRIAIRLYPNVIDYPEDLETLTQVPELISYCETIKQYIKCLES